MLELGLDVVVRSGAIRRIVGRVKLSQNDAAAVVQAHRNRLALRIVHCNLLRSRYEIRFDRRMVVLAREGIALGRALVIVEGHTAREHIDQCEPVVTPPGLNEWYEL